MTDTATIPIDGLETGACVGDMGWSGDVRDLDSRAVLDLVVARRRASDRAEADLLAGVVQLVDLDPVTDPEDAAYHPSNESPELAVFAGLRTRIPLAGDGAPQASQETVAALGAALGISYRSALGLVGECLELCYRLPRLWALVRSGRLQAWKARRVARATTWLSPGRGRVRRPAPGRHRDPEPGPGEPHRADHPSVEPMRSRAGRRPGGGRAGGPARDVRLLHLHGYRRHRRPDRPDGHPGRPRPRPPDHRDGHRHGPSR